MIRFIPPDEARDDSRRGRAPATALTVLLVSLVAWWAMSHRPTLAPTPSDGGSPGLRRLAPLSAAPSEPAPPPVASTSPGVEPPTQAAVPDPDVRDTAGTPAPAAASRPTPSAPPARDRSKQSSPPLRPSPPPEEPVKIEAPAVETPSLLPPPAPALAAAPQPGSSVVENHSPTPAPPASSESGRGVAPASSRDEPPPSPAPTPPIAVPAAAPPAAPVAAAPAAPAAPVAVIPPASGATGEPPRSDVAGGIRGAPPAGAPGSAIAAAAPRAADPGPAPARRPASARAAAIDPEPAAATPRGVLDRPAVPAQVIERARRAMVAIAGPEAGGLGFVVDPTGLIVTSHRLLGRGSSLAVRLHDGRRLPVTLIARDPLTGVAVLKVDAAGLPAIALGSSGALRVGDPVLALGIDSGAPVEATTGRVSATGLATGGDLATDLPASPARAGAPLLNAAGEAVGVATGEPGARVAAIPIDRVKPILLDLKRTAVSRETNGTAPGSGR